MPDLPRDEEKQRRVVAPSYVFDPQGFYEDPNVQAWAEYYAAGGTDLTGTCHFISVPGLTTSSAQPDSSPTILSYSDDERDGPVASSSASGSQSHPVPPKGPRRKLSARKGVLGLLEFLHLTSSKRPRNALVPPPPPRQFGSEQENTDYRSPEIQANSKPSPAVNIEDRVRYTLREVILPLERPDAGSHVDLTSGPLELEVSTGEAPDPPTYAESVYDPASRGTTPFSSAYSNGKASFSPSVSFGESVESSRPLPYPTPSPAPPGSDWRDEKVPSYESRQFTVNRVESSVDNGNDDDEIELSEAVPHRLSQIEENLEPAQQNSFKPLYHNMMSLLLMEVSPVHNTTTNSVIDTLNEYAESLRSFDAVTSLVRSHIYRGSLLQVASVLGMSDDPRVRRALQADETDIAEMLNRVSISDTDREAVLALEGDEAQSFLNVVQDVLDRGFLLRDPAESTQARRLLVKLSTNCYKLPLKLFIEGVTTSEEHATFGGGFGDVFRATYKGQVVALKRMRIFQRDNDLPQKRRKFCQEALTWQSLKHAYIVPFLGIVAEQFPTVLCMVSPWMRHGTVLKHLNDNGRCNVNKRLYEIGQGLEYLHSQNVVHGDLRGSNILINDSWEACLTDFGLTVFNDATPATYTSRHEGSVRWMAPELFMPQKFGTGRFRLTPQSDIFAFACVCLELYTGHPPFYDIYHDPGIILKVTQGDRPQRPDGLDPDFSDDMWRLVEACWSQKYADRPSTKNVVGTLKELAHSSMQSLPLHDVLIPSPTIVGFNTDVEIAGRSSPDVEVAARDLDSDSSDSSDRTARRGSPKHVRFSVPDSASSSSSSSSNMASSGTEADYSARYEAAISSRNTADRRALHASAMSAGNNADQRARYDAAIAARTLVYAALPDPPRHIPIRASVIYPDSDDSSSSSGSSSSGSSTVEDPDSSSSSFFDPELLVSPRSTTENLFFKDSMSIMPTPTPVVVKKHIHTDVEHERMLQDEAIAARDRAFRQEMLGYDMSLVSVVGYFVKYNVPRELSVWRGELYPNSFTNDDLVTTIESLLKDLQNPLDAPLPISPLASDIARSLLRQNFVKSVVPVQRRMQSNVFFFGDEDEDEDEQENLPRGVFPALTVCYSPSCSELLPCFTYTCPRWAPVNAKPRITNLTPEYVQPSKHLSIGIDTKASTYDIPQWTPLGAKEPRTRSRNITPRRPRPELKKTPTITYHAAIAPVDPPESGEGDLLDGYWEIVDQLDSVCDNKFELPEFSQEVTRKVDMILHPPSPSYISHGQIFAWTLASLLSLPFVYAVLLCL